MSSAQSGPLAAALLAIQDVDIEQLVDDKALQAETLSHARKLTSILEGPVNRATDLVFKPYTTVAARIAVDLDLFKHISSAGDNITSHELVSLTKADESLISRILRLLASIDFVENPSKDTWSANATTYAMNSPPIAAGHRFVYDALVSSAIKAPEYLQKTSYRTPSQPTDTFFQYAKQTDLPFFEHLQTTPSLAADFNLFMGNTMGAREYWHEWYPVEKRLLVDFDENRSDTLLVDVGGGKGHDLQAFYTAFGKSKSWKKEGKLVLQELPHVLDAIPDGDLPPVVVKMTHDFFAEQPVKGARGYFLHHILHDWPDKYCHKILRALRQAMIPGYSKLLIHELILPDTGAAEIQARFDLVMMTLGGGAERSRAQWIGLLEDAGFCNIKLYEHLDHDGIIEAEASEKHVTVVN